MQLGGYATHFVGKWDAGMATPSHTPLGRGYQSSLNYFNHENDYWSESQLFNKVCATRHILDLWDTDAPAYGMNGTGQYEEYIFQDRLTSIIQAHDVSQPLFLFYGSHIAHVPLEVPEEQFKKFDFMDNDTGECIGSTPFIYPGHTGHWRCRQQYVSMVNLLDGVVANITTQFKQRGMWNNTLMVFSADSS